MQSSAVGRLSGGVGRSLAGGRTMTQGCLQGRKGHGADTPLPLLVPGAPEGADAFIQIS